MCRAAGGGRSRGRGGGGGRGLEAQRQRRCGGPKRLFGERERGSSSRNQVGDDSLRTDRQEDMTAAFNGASGARPYLFLCSFDRNGAAQPVVKHLVGLQLAGCSRQGGEAGQTQLETGRRGFGRGRRRRRSRPLQENTKSHDKTAPGGAGPRCSERNAQVLTANFSSLFFLEEQTCLPSEFLNVQSLTRSIVKVHQESNKTAANSGHSPAPYLPRPAPRE